MCVERRPLPHISTVMVAPMYAREFWDSPRLALVGLWSMGLTRRGRSSYSLWQQIESDRQGRWKAPEAPKS